MSQGFVDGAAIAGEKVGMSDLLLVDDDRRIADLVAFFLRKRGHVVRVARSFVAARAELGGGVPDLMLSDVDLGIERADEELPKLAAEGVLPPTLIVSGYVDAELEERLLGIPGVIGLLRKPFDFAMLEARIEAALAGLSEVKKVAAGAVDDEDGWVEVRSFEDDA